MHFSKQLTIVVAVAVLGAPAGFLIAEAASGDDPPALWRPPTTGSPVPATDDQKAAFAVLGTAQRREDDDDALVEDLATRSGVGMDASGARVVGATAAGAIWLIPATDGLCLGLQDDADTSLGATCEPSDDVITRGTTVGDGATVYGVVPDGTTTVTVTPSGGAETAVSVDAGGVYTVPEAPATVAVEGDSGRTEFSVDGGG